MNGRSNVPVSERATEKGMKTRLSWLKPKISPRLHLGTHRITHHVLTQQQRTVAAEMHVRIRPATKLVTQDDPPVTMDVEHPEALTVERPQNPVGIELEPAKQMRRLFDIQSAPQIERGIVLQEAAAPGVIIVRII